MDICYIHMFIHAEFEIIKCVLKERRTQFKRAY